MRIKKGRVLGLTIAIFIALLSVGFVGYRTLIVEAASDGDVVINELMYNPDGSDEDLEYIELYNTTASPIDLENWCFSEGVTLVTSYADTACFDVGTTIAANGYLLVSPNPTKTTTTYSQTAVASYAGTNLSNGGETVTLIDENDAVIDSVTYDDANPWPTSPDGDGPSLELKDSVSDNSQATNWGASVGGPTPGAENSWLSLELPTVSNVTDPNGVGAGTNVNITAEVADANTVQLIYKVDFNSTVAVTMYDDGAHNDGAASDGTYGASIPGQTAGKLVRYKVNATNNDGVTSAPGTDDSIEYYGYTISNSSVVTNLPVLQWFIDPSDYTDMVTNHVWDDQKFDCVIAYGDEVFDNAEVWVKGGVSRTFPKKSFAVDLPAGYKLQVPGLMDREVDEFHLNADWYEAARSKLPVVWKIAKEQGMDVPDVFKARVQQNGQFFGQYTFLEEYDDAWREAFGYNSGAFYKTNLLKTDIDIDPNADLLNFQNNLAIPPSDERREYALDNLDVPNIINYMAFMAIIRNWEWHNGKNLNKYHDINGTGRWKMLPQDIDGAMAYEGLEGETVVNLVTPYEVNGHYMSDYIQRFQFFALYGEPDFREMYYRRLRTMVDEYYSNDRFLEMFNDQFDELSPDIDLDQAKWGSHLNVQQSYDLFVSTYNDAKKNFLVRFRKQWAVPEAQTSNPVVDIETINTSVGNEANEYIKLTNNTGESIDISGWRIEELDYTIPYGSVLLAGASSYLVKDDVGYKTANPGTYILGEYPTSVNDIPGGHLSLLRRDNSESDGQDY